MYLLCLGKQRQRRQSNFGKDGLVVKSTNCSPRGLSYVPRTHNEQLTASCNSNSEGSNTSSRLRQPLSSHMHVHMHTHVVKNNFFKKKKRREDGY